MDDSPVGRSAAEIAQAVREGKLEAGKVVAFHLDRIDELQPRIGAFRSVRRERALQEADELGRRPDLSELPLAGVPIAIKDNIDVAGVATGHGSAAFPNIPADADHEVVRRLRAAGAVVVGKTEMPELGLWPSSDGSLGTARNPWNLETASGGSSGGSAAAVSSAMVPVAHGNDGAGSIRIPAAVCGLYGIKPGHGVVPQNRCHWFDMTENGPLATTVSDAATVLGVMAARPELGEVAVPDRKLTIAVSTRPPLHGIRVAREIKEAVLRTAEILQREGHRVIPHDPPYNASARASAIFRWFAGPLDDLPYLERHKLQKRSKRHLRAGEIALKLRFLRDVQSQTWQKRVAPLFQRYDALLLPTVSWKSIDVGPWAERSWLRNVWTALNFAPFTGLWNLAPFPAASIPADVVEGSPIGVQMVASPGGEGTILSLSLLLEQLRPWPRHAPLS